MWSVLTFLSQNLFSQITLQGVVRDNWQMPVPSASVELTDQLNGARKYTGATNQRGEYRIDISQTRVDENTAFPAQLALLQNFPNPFNPSTIIPFRLNRPQELRIEIYNLLGQKVKTLYDGFQYNTVAQVVWDGTDEQMRYVPAGLYICSMYAEGMRLNRKMILMAGHRMPFLAGATDALMAEQARPPSLDKPGSNLYRLRIVAVGMEDYIKKDMLIDGSMQFDATVYRKISDIQRDSLLTNLAGRFDSLRVRMSRSETASQMVQYLKTCREFEAVGSSQDGTAWGMFADGRLSLYVNNFVFSDTLAISTKPSSELLKRAFSMSGNPTNTPKSNLMFYCPVFTPEGTYVAGLAHKVGYNPKPVVSIDQLKTQVKNAGIFFITTHGGYPDPVNGVIDFDAPYCLWTTTKQSSALDKTYKTDLDSTWLVYMTAQVSKDGPSEKRYAITDRFVKKYMTFADNSLVYISACESAPSAYGLKMMNACFAKNASVYAGWTSDLDHGYGIVAASLFFDRALGSNDLSSEIEGYVWKEDPPQRPFDWSAVLDWMKSKKYDFGDELGASRLEIQRNSAISNPCGPLAPSIASMFVHPYEQTLTLWGIFGDDPGSDGWVEINGVPVQAESWGRDDQVGMDKIVCKIPDDGPQSFGPVQVVAHQIKSNKTPLSRYKGDFTLIHDTNDGRQYQVKLTLQFRVHLLGFRMKPGDAPQYNQKDYVVHADMGSKAESFATGSTQQLMWTGHNDNYHNNIDGTGSPVGFICGAWFDPDAHKVQVYLSGYAYNGIIMSDGSGSSVVIPLTFGLDDFDGKHDGFQSYFEASLSEDYSIQPSPEDGKKAQKVAMYFSMLKPMIDTVKIKWGAISCESPPLEDTPR